MEELHAFRLTPQNLPALAAFMAQACPQWWDEAGAAGQLSGTGLTIGTVGWLLGKDETHLSGWLLCRELFLYHCLEVECCGFFQQGRFFLEHRLGALFCEAERYARQKGCTALRTAMGSEGFSLHGRPLGNIGQELQALSAPGRQDFHWLLSQGFRRWASNRTHWAAISTACFSPKSFDASLHKAARGIRPLWMPRAAFSLKGICAVRFAGRLTGFPLCLSVLCAQGPPCAFPAYFCKPAACAAGFFHFPPHAKAAARRQKQSLSLPQSSCPLQRRRRSRRMRSTLWARR